MSAIIVNSGGYFDDSSAKSKGWWEWTDKLVKVQLVSDGEKEKFEQVTGHRSTYSKVDLVGRAQCVLCMAEIIFVVVWALTEH